MRTLIKTNELGLQFCLSIVLATAALGLAHASQPIPILEVTVHGKYGTQWTQVFKSGKNWVCKTDLVPYHEISKQPFDLKLLEHRMPASLNMQPCRAPMLVVDRTSGVKHVMQSCGSSGENYAFLDMLGRRCGR